MKKKLLLATVLFSAFAIKAHSQESSRGYNEHAVPAFDNETKEMDWSKIEVLPIKLYKPELNKQGNPENGGGGNTINAVTDNVDVQVFPSAVAQSEQHMTVSKVNPLLLIKL